MTEPCSQDNRFLAIERDIKEIKVTQKEHSNDINKLHKENAETHIYIKQIFERIDDLKVLFVSGTTSNNKFWQELVRDLIKVILLLGAGAGILKGAGIL